MPLAPGYGETPIPGDEFDSLLPEMRELLGTPITKTTVYDLEQAVQEETAERLLTAVFDATLTVDELLDDYFVRELH